MVKKAQASVEFVAIIAISLMALFGVWYYVTTTNESVKQELNVAYARQAVSKLKDAADLVYVQGYPAQMSVKVQVPQGVTDAIVGLRISDGMCGEKAICLTLRTPSGESDVVASTIGPVKGDITKFTSFAGPHVVTVAASVKLTGEPFVNVTD